MSYARTAREVVAILVVVLVSVTTVMLATSRDHVQVAVPRAAIHQMAHPILGHPAPEPDMSLPANNRPDVNLQPDYLVCDPKADLCWSLWVDGPGY